jgi:hypothetical protein
VLCVLAHYVYEILEDGERHSQLSRLLIFLAAALPVVSGGLRTLQAAHEFSRNRARYRAAALTLANLEKILVRDKPAEDKLQDMAFCEQTLELEHREWAGLMNETEIMP